MTTKLIAANKIKDWKCPKCESTEVEGHSVEIEDGVATQESNCLACGFEWVCVYTFSSIYLRDTDEMIEIPR